MGLSNLFNKFIFHWIFNLIYIVNKSIVESNGFLFEPVHRRSLSILQGSADLRKNHLYFPSTDLALRG